jgi:hypothetical protein
VFAIQWVHRKHTLCPLGPSPPRLARALQLMDEILNLELLMLLTLKCNPKIYTLQLMDEIYHEDKGFDNRKMVFLSPKVGEGADWVGRLPTPPVPGQLGRRAQVCFLVVGRIVTLAPTNPLHSSWRSEQPMPPSVSPPRSPPHLRSATCSSPTPTPSRRCTARARPTGRGWVRAAAARQLPCVRAGSRAGHSALSACSLLPTAAPPPLPPPLSAPLSPCPSPPSTPLL